MKLSTMSTVLFRRKTFEGGAHLESKMKRCLTVLDVMFIAIGHMIGAGIYVLTGSVVRNQAGPAIILSFIFSGFAALLSAFSYAEFGARFPRAGSAYTYSYVGLGEIWAFVVGWTVPLEYMIGNAAVARSWSAYFDNLVQKRVANWTLETVGQLSDGKGFFAHYPDFLAFFLLILVAIAVAMGSKFSANVNTSFVVLNLAVLAFVIICGLSYADFSLWSGTYPDGRSKFFPYGFGGAISGASTCFFAFIGFEALATAGEEAKNPHRTIPLATFSSLAIISVIYLLMGASLTLMVPYDEVDAEAAFAAAFQARGANVAMIIMSIGALAGMLNNLVTGSFALPRAVYAMADDGLIFGWFGVINSRTKTPLNATIVFTILNALLALIFDLQALVDFLSIGTLLAYSMVSVCVLILRHQQELKDGSNTEYDNGGTLKSWVPFRRYWQTPGMSIRVAVVMLIFGYVCLALPFKTGIISNFGGIILLIIGAIFALSGFFFILGHEQNKSEASYKVPFVPFVPSLGLLINVFMMVFLNAMTWIRLFVWLAIGVVIYLFYGVRHSKEGLRSGNTAVVTELQNGIDNRKASK
uniref:AA_permease_C domain-containing protein n=1 Tax=Caenorhabditis japonica TaxID=281687 RepID=A0A8R1DZR8_CAEJA